MRTFQEFLTESVSEADFKKVESFADRLFSKFGIDVEFTKHFKDRVNDARNRPKITMQELVEFFKKAFVKHVKAISSMPADQQAVLVDMQKELNLPFVYKWDGRNFEFDLVAKTIMRKKNFGSSDKKLSF